MVPALPALLPILLPILLPVLLPVLPSALLPAQPTAAAAVASVASVASAPPGETTDSTPSPAEAPCVDSVDERLPCRVRSGCRTRDAMGVVAPRPLEPRELRCAPLALSTRDPGAARRATETPPMLPPMVDNARPSDGRLVRDDSLPPSPSPPPTLAKELRCTRAASDPRR